MKTSVAILAQESLCLPLVGHRSAVMSPKCLWDGTPLLGLGTAQHDIQFIANFSHRDLDHVQGIPHVWVNIGYYKGQKHTPYGKVSTAIRLNVLMVGHTNEDMDQIFAIDTELLVRRLRWVLALADEAVERIVCIHPCGLSVGIVHKITSVRDQSDVHSFCIRLKTDPSLSACPQLHKVHHKIGKRLLDIDAKSEVRGQGSTVRDSKEVTKEIKGMQKQTKDKQGKETKETKQTKDKHKGPVTKEQAAAAASPKLKSQSKTKGRSEQGQSKNPEDVAHDSGSEYESDGSEVLRRSDGSLNVAQRSSGPAGPRSASPRSERPRSECSSREHFRRESPSGKDARSRSRSEHRRQEPDRRDVPRRERPRSVSPRSSGPKARSLLNEIFDKEFTLVLRNDSTAARAMALTSGPGCMRQIDLKMTFMQDFVKKKIVDVQKIGTLNHDPPEIAEITKYVKVSVVHVQKHLSALLVVASILGSAAGVEDDYDREEDWKQGWSAKTVILFVLFYGTYFGIIIGAWEATKFCLKKLLVKVGLGGPKKLHNEQAIPVIPRVAATGGHIYMTKLAGERYHTRNNCGHIMGREPKVIEKCLDCARLDR